MKNLAVQIGRRIARLATATPVRATISRYVGPVVFVGLLFGTLPHTPLDGPVAGVIALLSVVLCSWFAGPGPALLMPLAIWIASRISLDEPDATWIPSGKQVVAFLAISLLTGAIGLAGQFQRRLRATTVAHATRLRDYLAALSRAHIVFRELDGRISAWNDGAQRLYGWSSGEAEGQLIHELLQTKFPVALDEIRARLASDGQWIGEVEQRCKDGRILMVAVHCIRYSSGENEQEAVAEIHNDVTEHRRAEAALRESDRRKDLFVATLAHELRNPLAPLQSGLEVMRVSPPGSAAATQIQEIMQRQLNHIVRMVDDLLDVSRITTGKIKLRLATVNLADVVRDALEATRPLFEGAGHDLQVTPPEQPIELQADAARLVQVLVNLLSNAAKFTPSPGRVRLLAEYENGEVAIRVEDNGVGIDVAALPHIFDVFAQVDRVHFPQMTGLGLGLSLVRTFVEMHGGTVFATSAGPGTGTQFTVRLPATIASAAPLQPSDDDPASADEQPAGRVLIVDDNHDAASTLSMLLREVGYDTRSVFDGRTALSVAGEFDPHAIVLDLGMPGMDGLEVARQLRSCPARERTLLIAVTGWDKVEDRRRTREAGFDHHLAKPVQLQTLCQLLRAARSDGKVPALSVNGTAATAITR